MIFQVTHMVELALMPKGFNIQAPNFTYFLASQIGLSFKCFESLVYQM
jgi:hypothetical protein